MKLVHVELSEANEFVKVYHRHHKPVVGHRFSIGVMNNGILVGVAIVGRPVSREIDQHNVVEITRLCTDGTKNSCSFLYGAAARASKALGYKKIQTYILSTESGTSLRASNYSFEYETNGGTWSCKSRKRNNNHPLCKKQKWSLLLSQP
jgi:hypothetical protein